MKTIFTLTSILFINFLFAQTAPEIEWQNTIGGTGDDLSPTIKQTSDGGYILAGSSASGVSGDKTEELFGGYDYWIIKMNSAGVVVWETTIGGDYFDYLFSVDETIDGGYIVGGYSSSGISGNKTEGNFGSTDYWIIKLDSLGDINWQKTFGGSGADELTCIEQTSDLGYIIGGYSNSGISGNKTEETFIDVFGSVTFDYWVIKLDITGNISWQNTIGGNGHDYLNSIMETSDGGFMLGGNSISGMSGDKIEEGFIDSYDYWMVKIDEEGNLEWQNTIGGTDDDYLTEIQQTTDEGYIVGGYSISGLSGDKTEEQIGSEDFWILKLNDIGEIEWQNTIGGDQPDQLLSCEQTSDGNYIVGGYSYSEISGDKTEPCLYASDYWILKLNIYGEIIWQNTIAGGSYDYLYSIQQMEDNGYILAGYSSSYISGDKTEDSFGSNDFWVVKLEAEEISEPFISSIIPSGETSFCKGENVLLNTIADETYSYQWKKDGINIPEATSSSYLADKPGNYQAYISNGIDEDISDYLVIAVFNLPNSTITNQDITNDLNFDNSIQLKAHYNVDYAYQWMKDGIQIEDATDHVYSAIIPGFYSVEIININGCENVSESLEIINSSTNSINQMNENIFLNIYPNPAKEELQITISDSETGTLGYELEIYDITGNLISTHQITNEKTTLDVKYLNAGIYFFKFIQNENSFKGSMVEKVIIE